MRDMFDYLLWRGDLPFDRDPVNSVDALIFSTLVYLDFSGIVSGDFQGAMPLRAVAEELLALPDASQRCRVKNDLKLLEAAAKTERFGAARMVFYRNEVIPQMESQFAAVTWLLADGTAMLCFRGTDNTLVGWKEDFNMSFQEPVPAQEKALHYTRAFARIHDLPLRLCGHSKGGNLAVYAAARCTPEEQNRILEVYNNDGPGFTGGLMTDPGYRAMVPKIRTYVPQSSVVGMLLEHEEPYTVIHSRQVGIMQHDPYSWEVLGSRFETVEEITGDSKFLNQTIKTWLAGKSMAERNEFVDTVFDLLSSGSADNTRQIMLPKNVLSYLRTLTDDEPMRRLLSKELSELVRTAAGLRRNRPAPQLPDPEEEAPESTHSKGEPQ